MRSSGSKLLGAVEATQAQIARRIGVSRATVGHWITGRHVPTEAHRDALLAAYRIPRSAWPDEYAAIRDVVLGKLAERAPDLLAEILDDLEAASGHSTKQSGV